jgi:hypothetical protein
MVVSAGNTQGVGAGGVGAGAGVGDEAAQLRSVGSSMIKFAELVQQIFSGMDRKQKAARPKSKTHEPQDVTGLKRIEQHLLQHPFEILGPQRTIKPSEPSLTFI